MLTEDPQFRDCVSSLSQSHPDVRPWVADVEVPAMGKEWSFLSPCRVLACCGEVRAVCGRGWAGFD